MTQLIAKIALALITAASFLVVSAKATIMVVEDPGTQRNVSGISHVVEGDDMAGILVTATFFDGSFETVPWAASGIGAGIASGTDWSLSAVGDTYFTDWILTNDRGSGLTTLEIDAWSGDMAFDLSFGTLGLEIGTPTSDLGFTFGDLLSVSALYQLPGSDATATYSDLVALSPSSPVGDLYGRLTISFDGTSIGNLDEGFPSGGGPLNAYPEFRFRTDTDAVQPVPEPSTVALGLTAAVFGTVGFAVRRRRKRRQEDQ